MVPHGGLLIPRYGTISIVYMGEFVKCFISVFAGKNAKIPHFEGCPNPHT